MTPAEMADSLRDIARKARRMPPPSHRDPEAFHIARDEIGRTIEQLANSLSPPRRSIGRTRVATQHIITIGNRRVIVQRPRGLFGI